MLGVRTVEDEIVGRENKRDWNPDIEFCRLLKFRRRNSDDRKALSIKLDRLPDRIRLPFEPPFPESRTDHCNSQIFRPLLLRSEEAANDGTHAHGLKKIRAYITPVDPFSLSRARQIDAAFIKPEGGYLLEALKPIPPAPGILIRVGIRHINALPDYDQL